jgi:hypothetical protein
MKGAVTICPSPAGKGREQRETRRKGEGEKPSRHVALTFPLGFAERASSSPGGRGDDGGAGPVFCSRMPVNML